MDITLEKAIENLNNSTDSFESKNKKHKGEYGHHIEDMMGVKHSSKILDASDGEVKTFSNNQTIAISQIDLINTINNEFINSKVYKKIENTLYFCRQTKQYKVIKLQDNEKLFLNLQEQYENIKSVLIEDIQNSNMFRTTNGINKRKKIGNSDLLQIRTKDSGKYTPIVYEGKQFTNKRMAWYLTKNFIQQYLKDII
jgi:hypothetical protein